MDATSGIAVLDLKTIYCTAVCKNFYCNSTTQWFNHRYTSPVVIAEKHDRFVKPYALQVDTPIYNNGVPG